MKARVTGGEEVRILTSGGEVDPNIYNVKFVKHGLVGLTCRETGITIKVNNQRIHKIIKEKNMNNDGTAVLNETTIDTPEFTSNENETQEQTQSENTEKKTSKAPPEKIDFDAMVEAGFEVWTKTGLSLGSDPKISAISVAAHCVIDPESADGDRGYEVFNSYNGTRGAKGKGGKHYLFTEKMTVEKKRKALEKKGYIQHQV